MLRLEEDRAKSPIISLSDESSKQLDTLLYQSVKLTGYFDNQHQILLDNQIYNGKAGYFVLTPLLLKDQTRSVLINRGWLPVGTNRADLPDISISTDEVSISGRINRFPKPGLILAGAEIPSNTWPATVQVIDIKVVDKLIGHALFDFQVELAPTSPDGFIRDWKQVPTMPPEKHQAYAFQWFLLALLLVILLGKYGFSFKSE